MEKVTTPFSSSAGVPQSATEREESRLLSWPCPFFLGPLGGSVSYDVQVVHCAQLQRAMLEPCIWGSLPSVIVLLGGQLTWSGVNSRAGAGLLRFTQILYFSPPGPSL